MASDIALRGAVYPSVPAVLLPKNGGGIVRFTDVSGTTAGDADVASGKVYFKADGSQSTGTASGGGGSSWTKLAESENSVSYTSTSAASAFTIELGAAGYTKDKIIWVHIRDKAGKRDNYFFGSDAFFINYRAANGDNTNMTIPALIIFRYSGTTLTGYAGQYGVFGYSISTAGKLTVRKRYSSTYTLTINGTFVTKVYALDLPSGVSLF